MKCPNCQSEVRDEQKFCTQCGTRIMRENLLNVEETENALPSESNDVPKEPETVLLDETIEMPQEEGTVFINESIEMPQEEGTVLLSESIEMPEEEGTVLLSESIEIPEEEGTVLLSESIEMPEEEGTVLLSQSMEIPVENNVGKVPNSVPPTMVYKEKNVKKKNNTLTIVIVIIVAVFLLAGVAIGAFFILNRTTDNKKEETKESAKVQEVQETQDTQTEDILPEKFTQEEIILSLDVADQMFQEAEKKVKRDEELLEGIDLIRRAVEEYVKEATNAGNSLLVEEQVKKGCALYEQAILRRKELLQGLELSGGIYAQVIQEMDHAISFINNLKESGYSVDDSNLVAEKDLFDVEYREKIIYTFNEFTLRESWSRTESWNLMSQTDSMYASDDLDDPIRLRYAYALAWWVQKQIETDLNNGTITSKGAAAKIADVIKATDYNLMLIDKYISYMKEAGEECQEIETAYQEAIAHIAETQNLHIGQELQITRFWQFNDFGQYSCDSVNGITSENMTWIREYFENVTF